MQINAIGSASSKCVLQTAIILDKQQFLPVLVCGTAQKKPDKYILRTCPAVMLPGWI